MNIVEFLMESIVERAMGICARPFFIPPATCLKTRAYD